MKAWWRKVRPAVISAVAYAIVRTIGLTLRMTIENFGAIEKMPGGKILAGWHGRTFIAANYFKGRGVWTIISHSRDGEIQNRIFSKFGFKTIRGSTGRGGVRAAIEAIKVLREGQTMAFTPDGPRGPSGIVQSGIMLMAHKSGAALVPAGVSARPRWKLPTWDAYLIPYPFAKALMIFGDPICVPSDADEATIEQARLQLEGEMHRLEAEAERRMGFGTSEATEGARF